jgi:hypothetical protein
MGEREDCKDGSQSAASCNAPVDDWSSIQECLSKLGKLGAGSGGAEFSHAFCEGALVYGSAHTPRTARARRRILTASMAQTQFYPKQAKRFQFRQCLCPRQETISGGVEPGQHSTELPLPLHERWALDGSCTRARSLLRTRKCVFEHLSIDAISTPKALPSAHSQHAKTDSRPSHRLHAAF